MELDNCVFYSSKLRFIYCGFSVKKYNKINLGNVAEKKVETGQFHISRVCEY